MIARAIAHISASMAPANLLNCGTRTSSAARSVMSTMPVPRGSTATIRSRRLIVRRPIPTTPRISHRCPDHPDRLDRHLAIGVEVIGAVEVHRVEFAAGDKHLQVDDLGTLQIERLQLVRRERD